MNKKLIISIIVAVVIAAIASVGIWWLINNNNKKAESGGNMDNQSAAENISQTADEQKIAVVYFSATGTTEKVAGYIKNATGGDLFEIEPKETYTDVDLDYNTDNSRANNEQNDDSARPEIANVINIDPYDIIYLGYPIWWGDAPKIILTFLDTHDLTGKTVVPFCTSGSTGISGSESTLKNYAPDVNWLSGHRFGASASQGDVNNWVSGLNY